MTGLTEKQAADFKAASLDGNTDFINMLPHSRALKMELHQFENGQAEIMIPYGPHLVADISTGVVHGGVVTTLLDSCSGAAVMCHPQACMNTATLDLRIDYMRPATPGQNLRAIAECYNVTRSVAFVRATAYDDDMENPVATSSGAFTITRESNARTPSTSMPDGAKS